VPQTLGSFCNFQKTSTKEDSNRPMGENAPNLITLLVNAKIKKNSQS
jgi:hypothetical protein